MAKLYAEIDSDKKGRKSSKGGDTYIRIDIVRGNDKLGTLGIYEVLAGPNTPAGYRVIWDKEGLPYPKNITTLEDTTKEEKHRMVSAVEEALGGLYIIEDYEGYNKTSPASKAVNYLQETYIKGTQQSA